jgi:hypothetical protein
MPICLKELVGHFAGEVEEGRGNRRHCMYDIEDAN